MSIKNILYVESNIDGTIGGSYFSLLFLIKNIDHNKYKPIILFYKNNELIDVFKKTGCIVIIFNKHKPLNIVCLIEKYFYNKRYYLIKYFVKYCAILVQKIINFIISFIVPAFSCWKIIHREKIDLIHLNNTVLRPHEWILASLFFKTQVVAHERGINNKFPRHSRFFMQHLKAIFCISNAVKNNLINNGFPVSKLHLIYNGIDPNEFIVTRTKSAVLQELSIDEDCQLVGVVGNIKKWKGQEVAIRAMEIVVNKFPKAKCLFVGGYSPDSHKYYHHVIELVKSSGLEKNIVFAGHRKDVPNFVNILEVVIHTSILPEPFGRVILEGMCLSKPVITPKIGAGPEIVQNEKTGLVVRPEEPKELAEAIIYMLENPLLAESMGMAGRVRLERYFHIKQNILKTLEIYNSLLEN